MLSARAFRAFWVAGHKVHGQMLLRVGRGSRVGKQELMRALVPAAAVQALGDNFFVGFAGYDAPVNFIFGAVGTPPDLVLIMTECLQIFTLWTG
jgi:hypothetical protein